ncbi:reverse transcriptase [Gossypium australe]|uniref:Reverse transcriptase n=1 Tax=Gossypium australe TaxID=47621 RepID=A0A5B6VZ60_9ROSI|nr:reverse transcriptase [Gossypium australe]
METKLDEVRMNKVRKRCGFINGIDIPMVGTMGGLSLAWNGNDLVQLRSFSNNHIDVIIQRMPWFVYGDFNEILYSYEKIKRGPRDERQMEKFRKVLDECQLMDVDYVGSRFTWERGKLLETNIREMLDRGWQMTDQDFRRMVRRRFQFESWWVLEESCEDDIYQIWGENYGSVLDKLEGLKARLLRREKGIKEKGNKTSRQLNRRWEILSKFERNDEILAEIIDTKIHLNLEMEKYETYWE